MAENSKAKKALAEKGCTFSESVKEYTYFNGEEDVVYAKADILEVFGWQGSNRAFSRFVKKAG